MQQHSTVCTTHMAYQTASTISMQDTQQQPGYGCHSGMHIPCPLKQPRGGLEPAQAAAVTAWPAVQSIGLQCA